MAQRKTSRKTVPFDVIAEVARDVWELARQAQDELDIYTGNGRPEAQAFLNRNHAVLSNTDELAVRINDAIRFNNIPKLQLERLAPEVQSWLTATERRYRPIYEADRMSDITTERLRGSKLSDADIRERSKRRLANPVSIGAGIKGVRRLLDAVVVTGNLDRVIGQEEAGSLRSPTPWWRSSTPRSPSPTFVPT